MAINLFAMPSSSIILLLSAAFSISNALPWDGARPTAVYKWDEWTPRPTQIPADPAELFKRASLPVNICGWLGGNSASPVVCQTGSSCVHDTLHGYIGCCATAGPCTAGVYSSCVDSRNTKDWAATPLWQNNGVVTCPQQQQCYTNSYPGNYLQWACGASSDATTVQTTFSGQATDQLLQVVFTGVNFTPVSVSASTTSSTTSSNTPSSTTTLPTTAFPTGTQTSAPTNAGKQNDTPTNTGSSVNGGVIAAAVIVPLIILALAGTLFWIWRRKQNFAYGRPPRPSSFTGAFKSSSSHDSKQGASGFQTIHNAQPYSPDDFVSPMTDGGVHTGVTPPMNPSLFSPPNAYRGIDERLNAYDNSMGNDYDIGLGHSVDNTALNVYNPRVGHSRDNSAEHPYASGGRSYAAPSPEPAIYYPPEDQTVGLLGTVGSIGSSEINDFRDAYMGAINGLSPPTPPQPPRFQDVIPSSPSGHIANVAVGIPAGAIVSVINRPRTNTAESFDAGINDPLEKEMGFASKPTRPKEARPARPRNTTTQSTEPFPTYEAVGFRSENVRREDWQPPGLRPKKGEDKPNSPQRYELVDQPPSVGEGVAVLHKPGQLRNKGGRKLTGTSAAAAAVSGDEKS